MEKENEFGQRVRAARQAAGLKQRQLVDIIKEREGIDVTVSHISRLETGERGVGYDIRVALERWMIEQRQGAISIEDIDGWLERCVAFASALANGTPRTDEERGLLTLYRASEDFRRLVQAWMARP